LNDETDRPTGEISQDADDLYHLPIRKGQPSNEVNHASDAQGKPSWKGKAAKQSKTEAAVDPCQSYCYVLDGLDCERQREVQKLRHGPDP